MPLKSAALKMLKLEALDPGDRNVTLLQCAENR